jgi:hypothetical protein
MPPSDSPPNPPTIFISYRRSETAAHAGRLAEHLTAHFGSQVIFIDNESIEPGKDFVEAIEDAVSSCKILLALVGRQWLTCSDEHGRRLDNPNDFVRMEISTALRRGVRVIPVLIQGATMPRDQELPAALASLARKQAWEVTEIRWKQDVRQLINRIEKDLKPLQPDKALDISSNQYFAVRKRNVIAVISAFASLIFLLGTILSFSQGVVIENPTEVDLKEGTYKCNKISCPIFNRFPDKKIIRIEVELTITMPNIAPGIVRQQLELDASSSGAPFKTSTYSALLDFDEGADIRCTKLVNVLAVKK